MEIMITLLVIIYMILMVFGFQSTWKFSVSIALEGSSEILFSIILFLLMILIVGPIMGIVNIVKRLIQKCRKTEAE